MLLRATPNCRAIMAGPRPSARIFRMTSTCRPTVGLRPLYLPSALALAMPIQLQDWLGNSFAAEGFDRAYAVESSEHMPDKQRFFNEAFRTLRPNGLFVVCAWLARDEPRRWEVRYLLEPICREGRLPGMGDEADYRQFAQRAGFRVLQVEDLSDQVSRTWWICVRRALGRLATRPRYLRFLMDGHARNRVFAVTLLRIMIAYRTRSMRYCLLVFERAGREGNGVKGSETRL